MAARLARPALLALSMLAAVGCAPRSGWTRTQARSCAPEGPPVMCFRADPDQPLELRAGDLVLLPGECALGPERRGGSMQVRLVDGRTPNARSSSKRRVHVPRGRRTVLVADEGKSRVGVARERCSVTPQ